MAITITGGVIVGAHEYLDDEILMLVGTTVLDEWDFSGDQLPEESNIVVNGVVFEGADALPHALAYCEKLDNTDVELGD